MSVASTIAEIDLEAVAHNVRALRAAVDPSARFMAVVKANAYGHGCIQVSETALSTGADALGVARIEEGKRLREAGLSAPILVFGYIPDAELYDLIKYELTATAFSVSFARCISDAALRHGATIRVHAKVDTGMGRLGVFPDLSVLSAAQDNRIDALTSDLIAISKLPGLDLRGLYTHFSTADTPGCPFAAAQLHSFRKLLTSIRKTGLDIPICHAANSGALIHMPESHLDMVRPGISIYGLYPSMETDRSRVCLKPAMSLKTRIVHLKKVPAGFSVSYGRTHETQSPTTIATIPIGYADGYRRSFSNKGQMLVRGRKASVVGRVCMDLALLDVGHIPGVEVGDEVVVFGSQGGENITADDLAHSLGTINYEIVTSVSDRIPRTYRGLRPKVDGQA